ncbi:MAG: SgcJ/EcaC family oxidoreductase [Planctomycetota bacterium]|nr:SgcJ/EcaC family oxidoreductase [Planctomycetota bacterium]
MKLISSLFIVALVAGAGLASAVGTSTNSTTKGDSMTDTDKRAIQTILDTYEKALNASDVEAVIKLYAHDGVFMPSTFPTAVGIESVRASYKHVFDMIKLNIAFTVDEIVADGSIAFARTGSKGSVTILADEKTVSEENRELFVFQKKDGVWKIARYMFNKAS